MASKEDVEQLRQISEECTKILKGFIARNDWKKSNLKEVQPDLEYVLSVFKDFLVLPIDLLPDRVIREIIEAAKYFRQEISVVAKSNSIFFVKKLNKQVDNFYHQFQSYSPHLA